MSDSTATLAASAISGLDTKDHELQISYTNSYVAFLDVLGFREIMQNKGLVQLYFNTCLDAIDIILEPGLELNITPFLMSDAIILATPNSEKKNDISNIARLTRVIQILQAALLQIGIFIRGGISEGEVYINLDKNVIVGKGLAQAYELEQLANNPRVIFDPKIIQNLGYTLRTFAKAANEYTLKHFQEPVIFDEFDINYFDVGLLQCDCLFVDWFSQILKLEDSNLTEFKELFEKKSLSNQAHLEKYRWAIRYMAYSSGLIKERSNNPNKNRAKELSDWLQNL